jgi:hypothetical protein
MIPVQRSRQPVATPTEVIVDGLPLPGIIGFNDQDARLVCFEIETGQHLQFGPLHVDRNKVDRSGWRRQESVQTGGRDFDAAESVERNAVGLVEARDRLLVDRDAGKQAAAFDMKIDHAAVGVEAGHVMAPRARPIADAQVEVGGKRLDANADPAQPLEKIRVAQIYAVESPDIDKKSVALEFEELCEQAIFSQLAEILRHRCGCPGAGAALACARPIMHPRTLRATVRCEAGLLVRRFKGRYKRAWCVARMKRSGMRDGRPRIVLRSIRATFLNNRPMLV